MDHHLPRFARCRKHHRALRPYRHIVLYAQTTKIRNIDTWIYAAHHALLEMADHAGHKEGDELMVAKTNAMPGDVHEVIA